MATPDLNDKIEFEMNTGVIVWDIGTVRGKLDADDIITNPADVCTIAGQSEPNALAIARLTPRREGPRAVIDAAKRILNRLGVNDLNVAMNPVSVLESNSGGPVFFLFPEVHPDYSNCFSVRSRPFKLILMTWPSSSC